MSKVQWLREGDNNTCYFHKVVRGKRHRSRIHEIRDVNGGMFSGMEVAQAFVTHYENFLGTQSNVLNVNDPSTLFIKRIPSNVVDHMIRTVTRDELKLALFYIDDCKSPGPEGYTSAFVKGAWNFIGDDITNAVLEFFESGQLLKEINRTIIALLPKVSTPTSVTDFRPICCCNVLYKCISKIITSRMKNALVDIVSDN